MASTGVNEASAAGASGLRARKTQDVGEAATPKQEQYNAEDEQKTAREEEEKVIGRVPDGTGEQKHLGGSEMNDEQPCLAN